MSEEINIDIKYEVDSSSVMEAMHELRGLLRTANSVRNLVEDTKRMASEPSVGNAFWLALQAEMTGRALLRGASFLTGQEITGAGLKFAAQTAIGMSGLSSGALLAGGIVGGAILVGGTYLLWEQGKREELENWVKFQNEVARKQGLAK